MLETSSAICEVFEEKEAITQNSLLNQVVALKRVKRNNFLHTQGLEKIYYLCVLFLKNLFK